MLSLSTFLSSYLRATSQTCRFGSPVSSAHVPEHRRPGLASISGKSEARHALPPCSIAGSPATPAAPPAATVKLIFEESPPFSPLTDSRIRRDNDCTKRSTISPTGQQTRELSVCFLSFGLVLARWFLSSPLPSPLSQVGRLNRQHDIRAHTYSTAVTYQKCQSYKVETLRRLQMSDLQSTEY